jgi:uncharacterized protein
MMQTDVCGMHKSQGHAGVLTDRDAEDYYDVIEWAASQPWCDGGVGLSGASYLAMSQWRVAALRPPHLKAIIPWEGVSDLYREMAFHGGIPETGFVPTWWKKRMKSGRNKQFDFAEDFLAEIDRHPLEDSYWRRKQTALERIDSPEKWLYTHGRKKWETYYEAEAVTTQKRFLDHYLKGQDNGWCATPRVRIEVRKAYYRRDVRHESHWPLPDTRFVPLYLDADQGALRVTPVATEEHIALTRNAAKRRFRFVLPKPWSSPARQSCTSGSARRMAMISTCSSC